MTDTPEDALVYDLQANLEPLMRTLEQGLRAVRSRLESFKQGEGSVQLSASLGRLLEGLSQGKGMVDRWKTQADASAVVHPTVDTRSFADGLRSLQEKAAAVADGLGKVFFGAMGFNILADSVGKLISLDNEQELAQAKLQHALGATGAAGLAAYKPMVEQAENLQRAVGQFGDEEIESSQAFLATLKLSEGQIKSLLPAIMDTTIGLQQAGDADANLGSVTKLVAKAVSGHAEGLQRLGVTLDETKMKADPVAAVMGVLTARFGGLSGAVAQTDAGKLKTFGEALGEIRESAGALLKAIVVPLAQAVTSLVWAFVSLPNPVKLAALALGALTVVMVATDTNMAGLIIRVLALADHALVAAATSAKQLWVALASGQLPLFIKNVQDATASVSAFANGMSLLGKASLVAMAAFTGWKIGSWLKDLEAFDMGVNDATGDTAQFSVELLESQRAHLKAKYGLDSTNEAMWYFNQLSGAAKEAVLAQARANGDLAISLDAVKKALEDQKKAQEDAIRAATQGALQQVYMDAKRYYSQSSRDQILEDIRTQQAIRDNAKSTAEQKEQASKKLVELARDLGREEVRMHDETAKKAEESSKKASDALRKATADAKKWIEECIQKGIEWAQKSRDAWESARQSMEDRALKAFSPQLYEEALVNREAFNAKILAEDTLSGEELTRALENIEIDRQMRIQAIVTQFHQKALEEQAEHTRKLAERDRQAWQGQQEVMQQYLDHWNNPMKEKVDQLLRDFGPKVAAFAQQVYNALQPMGNAIAQWLTGVKVKWGQVFQQMAQSFISQFIQKLIANWAAWVAKKLAGDKLIQASEAAGSATKQALSAKDQAQDKEQMGTSLLTAVANIFKAHSSIPWVGVLIAAAFIGVMFALFSSFKGKSKAMATGGKVSEPEIALLGEAGTEYVAPEKDFKEVVRDLVVGTIETVRGIAVDAGRVIALAGAQGPAASPGLQPGAIVGSEMHLHGIALMDSGQRGFVAETNRMMQKAAREARSLSFNDVDHVGS